MNPEAPLRIRFQLHEIAGAARQFWQWAEGQRVFAFRGSLGAGKTTFIHALCDMLGVQDAVSSPTFALINEYHFRNSSGAGRVILHMDWYRLQSLDEAIDAGMEDALLRPDALCFLEWPERASALLTMPHIEVNLSAEGKRERLLEARKIGQINH
jgi:tRNA threonylcarbamoyladenosine biosynthesis protein TsaE